MRNFVLAALIAMVSVGAPAQEQATATLYSKGHFSGPSVALTGPRTQMAPFTVESLRISPGSVWELCSGNTFSGCERYSESQPAMVRTVRSVRPVRAPIPQAAALPTGAPLSGPGPSLRGLASEFFALPASDGARVEVGQEAGQDVRAATDFCRAQGWRSPAYQRVQSVGGRTFLADVLCVSEDR